MATASSLLSLRLPRVSLPESSPARFPLQKGNNCRSLRRWASRCPLPLRASSSSSSGSSSAWEMEEARWLREEQRWLREENRWLREESRWNSERDALLRDIAALKLRIEELERDRPQLAGAAAAASLETLLRAMKDRVTGTESGSRVPPAALAEQADVQEMILEEITVSEAASVTEERSEGEDKDAKRRILRRGAEGVDVREMQEALQRLGFHSGEEDMEFETFSSGTERAVKTWQASLGTAEDGILSAELLQRLFHGPGETPPSESGVGGTAAGLTETQRKVLGKEYDDVAQVDVSARGVFLLGENRWEDPGRLAGRNGPIGGRATTRRPTETRCISCRGEGRLMCSECDGTGEPNIEPQFMEWVDEAAKCPYCEGLGYVVCDVCGG